MTGRGHLLLIAHRAGNDPRLVSAAEAAGADLVEADIWFYRGTLEVRHMKTMGPVPLLWDRWALGPAWTPRLHLAELVGAARATTVFFFDLKGSDPLLPVVLAEEMERIAPGRPYWICSQSWGLLEPFRHHPGVRVAHSIGSAPQLRAVWDHLTWHTNHAVSIHRKLLSPAAVAALKEKASTVVTWPINSRNALDDVVRMGVDGVTSDSLDLIAEVAASRRAVGTAPD